MRSACLVIACFKFHIPQWLSTTNESVQLWVLKQVTESKQRTRKEKNGKKIRMRTFYEWEFCFRKFNQKMSVLWQSHEYVFTNEENEFCSKGLKYFLYTNISVGCFINMQNPNVQREVSFFNMSTVFTSLVTRQAS